MPPLNMGDCKKDPLRPSEKISQNVFPTQIYDNNFSKSRKQNLSRFFPGIHTPTCTNENFGGLLNNEH